MRGVRVAIGLLLALAGAAQSRPAAILRGVPSAPEPDPRRAAADLRTACASQDQAEVDRILAQDRLDLFLVAHSLLGAHPTQPADAAFGALATRAAADPRHSGLPELIRRWQTLGTRELEREAERHAQLDTARTANDGKKWQEALDLVASGMAGEPGPEALTRARLLEAQATALRGLERFAEAAAAYRNASQLAEGIGWLGFAAGQCVAAGNAAAPHGDTAAALRDYERALRLQTRVGQRVEVAQLWRSLGALHYQNQDIPRALAAAERARQEYQALGNRGAAAEVLGDMGTLEAARGAHDQAIAHHRRAREEALAADHRVRAATSLGCIGTVLFRTGRAREAIAEFEQAARELEPLDERRERLLMLHWLGRAQLEVASFDAARQSLTLALQLAESEGDAEAITQCLGQLGEVALRRGDYPLALRHKLQALERCESAGDRVAAAGHRAAAGLCKHLLGDFAGALSLLEQALADQEALGDEDGAMATMGSLAGVYETLGLNEQALALQRRTVAYEERGGDPRGLAVALSNEASILGSLGRGDEALAGYQRALKICETIGERSGIATVLCNLGWCHLRARQFASAVDHFTRALGMAEEIGDRRTCAVLHSNLATTFLTQGRARDALRHVEQAIPDLIDAANQDALTSAYANLAEAKRQLGAHAEAIAAALRYQEIKLRQSRGLGDVASRSQQIQLPQAAETVLVSACALLAAQPEAASRVLEQAFTAVEGARATLLAESLVNGPGLAAGRVSAPLLDSQGKARDQVLAARRTLAQAAARRAEPSVLAAGRAELAAAYAAFEAATVRVQRAGLRMADAIAPGPAALTTVQGQLPEDTALVLFQLTRERVFALTVRRTAIALDDLGATAELEQRARTWLRILPAVESQDEVQATALYEILIRPLEARIRDSRRLLIAPDGILAFLPFEALRRTDGTSAQRLIERWEVAYVPSGTVHAVLASSPRTTPGEGLLALGDPIYPGESAAGSRPAARELELRGVPRLPRLLGSGAEVRTLAGLFGEERATVLVREAATHARLQQAASVSRRVPLRALHLACHAHVDGERPRLTGLLLSEGEVVSLDDICRLELGADLVVLSACESGRGRLQAGEGVIGLTRAFFCAGAPRVVVANWRIDDQAARSLMVEFYRGMLERGLSPGAALRAAKLAQLRAGGELAHPAWWAAFVLWGLPE